MAGLKNQPAPVLIDFFSGCGGTSEGFRAAGIEPVAAIDFDPDAAQTYERNFPKAKVFAKDITTLRADALDDVVADARAAGRSVVFSACAPCQPFSRQRRGAPEPEDGRIDLIAEVLRFVRRHRPDAIFLENVPGLEMHAGVRGPFQRVRRSLRRAGYHVTSQVVQARNYGVSERRARLVILASSHGPIPIPESTHGPGKRRYRTVRDAIAALPAVAAGETHSTINAHRAAKLSPLNARRIEATPKGGSRLDWPDELVLACHVGRAGSYTDTYGRLRWNSTAPALTTRCISYSNGRFGHPEQNRAITPREAAAIQTFPRSFIFVGSLVAMARQIGNAVPPRLARTFGETIHRHVAETLDVAA